MRARRMPSSPTSPRKTRSRTRTSATTASCRTRARARCSSTCRAPRPPSLASSTPWPASPTWSPSKRRSWSPTSPCPMRSRYVRTWAASWAARRTASRRRARFSTCWLPTSPMPAARVRPSLPAPRTACRPRRSWSLPWRPMRCTMRCARLRTWARSRVCAPVRSPRRAMRCWQPSPTAVSTAPTPWRCSWAS